MVFWLVLVAPMVLLCTEGLIEFHNELLEKKEALHSPCYESQDSKAHGLVEDTLQEESDGERGTGKVKGKLGMESC